MNIVAETATTRVHPGMPEHYPWAAGADLTMSDGSLWFHPFNGKLPIQVREPFDPRRH